MSGTWMTTERAKRLHLVSEGASHCGVKVMPEAWFKSGWAVVAGKTYCPRCQAAENPREQGGTNG